MPDVEIQPPRTQRLLEAAREAIRVSHYSYCTEQSYVHWGKRFVLFHGKRQRRLPVVLSVVEVEILLGALQSP